MRSDLTEHALTDRERLAFLLESVWETLGGVIEHGQIGGRVAEGTPLKVPASLTKRAQRIRAELRELAREAAPALGVCRAPVLDVGTTPARRRRG